MQIKHLLVAVAPEQQAVEDIGMILSLAQHQGAQITFLTVIDDLVQVPDMSEAPISRHELLQAAFEHYSEKLEQLVAGLSGRYPAVRFRVLVEAGTAFVKIIELANQLTADMIVINANCGDKRYASQFGSTTRHLMRKSNIPVWTTPRANLTKLTSVVAAVDVSEPGQASDALNRDILSSALEVAKINGAHLYVVYAWRNYAQHYLGSWNNENDLAIAIWAKAEQEKHLKNCQRLVAEVQMDGQQIDIELLEGYPKQALPAFVEKKSADLLVMGTICRTGISGMIIGNTAESILDAVDCSVMTLKPTEFVSPVLE